jgi:hypothetical protein
VDFRQVQSRLAPVPTPSRLCGRVDIRRQQKLTGGCSQALNTELTLRGSNVKSHVRAAPPETRKTKPDIRNTKYEARHTKYETRSTKVDLRKKKSGIPDPEFGSRNTRLETSSSARQILNPKPEIRGLKPDMRNPTMNQVLCPSIVASNLVNTSRYFLSQFAQVHS